MKSNHKLLVIGKVWPEPRSSAAGARILHILSIFENKGYTITFASASKRSEHSSNLSELGIIEQEIELNSSSFDDFVTSFNPDVVLFDRFMSEEQFGWRVSEAAPGAIRILDTEDIHFLRRARELCLKDGGNPESDFQPYLKNEVMVRELASMLRCDFSILISKYEIELLEGEFNFPHLKLIFLPLLVSDNVLEMSVASNKFEERKHFVTIGNFLHPPNRDSVLFLKDKIWPRIRAGIPDAELHVYGAYPDQKVWKLHDENLGFIIKGRAENVLKTLSNYRVMLAPLRFGAGQKGKLLDAMRTNLPSVTTLIGAEGMKGESEWPGFICSDFQEFIKKAVLLYSEKPEWEAKESLNTAILNDQFKYSKFASEFWIHFDNSIKQIQEIRSTDYLGEVLRNQSNNASKYLSKWIEEKNNKRTVL